MARVNPLDEAEVARVRREVGLVAHALASREVPFLEGVRKLAWLRFEVPGEHEAADLLLFTAIASQVDHIPSEGARGLCAESWVSQCDQEVQQLEEFYEGQVLSACARLVERFGGLA